MTTIQPSPPTYHHRHHQHSHHPFAVSTTTDAPTPPPLIAIIISSGRVFVSLGLHSNKGACGFVISTKEGALGLKPPQHHLGQGGVRLGWQPPPWVAVGGSHRHKGVFVGCGFTTVRVRLVWHGLGSANRSATSMCSWRGHLRGVHIHYCPGVLGGDTCDGTYMVSSLAILPVVFLREPPGDGYITKSMSQRHEL
ncbi:hypothetical protein Tco_1568376 [Tanacetum coccineum]